MTSQAASGWFIRLFAGAVIAHIAGNRAFGLDARGVVTLLLGVVASIALLKPAHRLVRIGLAVLTLATVWVEAPLIGNHWIVAGFTALALVGASLGNGDWWRRFAPTGRGILLAFYGFAAFAKLNSGFFDPDRSCGLFYANQSLASWGLAVVPAGGAAAVAIAVATTAIELAVPVLLFFRRTRPYGVMLGFVFHFVISLDLGQHFYDFTALLMALFSLFIADEVTGRWNQAAERHRPALLTLAAGSILLTVASVSAPTRLGMWAVQYGSFYLWIPTGLVLVGMVLRMPITPALEKPLLPRAAPGVALVALVVLNGLTPYLGIKTGYGFNMYANLHTAAGDSNHLVIRSTAQLVDVDYVTIVDSSDEGLAAYIDSGYLVPERNVLDHLADHPEESVTYLIDGREVSGTGDELGRPLPVLVEKFGLFRSVDTESPPRCQTSWLPAY